MSTQVEYPRTEIHRYESWPDKEGAIEMEFRLTYQGRLPAASQSNTRVEDKHRIRRELHPQLRELWKDDPRLRNYIDRKHDRRSSRLWFDVLADEYARCGYRFLPLVGGAAGDEACALDILFLRRDQPGGLIKSGGDIDNRIKVLLDALRVPGPCSEVAGDPPTADEDPLFCLLTDDKLITEIRIVTDRLLTPIASEGHEHDVQLIIHARTISYARYLAIG